jgi:hypothetical protein
MPATSTRWVPVAAVALMACAAWVLRARHTTDLTSVALQTLTREVRDLDFRTDEVDGIRGWVLRRTGLEIPLPERTARGVRLTGVCAVKGGGVPGVAVAFCVRGRNAALVVSKASSDAPGGMKHRFLKSVQTGGARVSSWTMHGQLYTLAYAAAADARDECLLCHSEAQHLALAN